MSWAEFISKLIIELYNEFSWELDSGHTHWLVPVFRTCPVVYFLMGSSGDNLPWEHAWYQTPGSVRLKESGQAVSPLYAKYSVEVALGDDTPIHLFPWQPRSFTGVLHYLVQVRLTYISPAGVGVGACGGGVQTPVTGRGCMVTFVKMFRSRYLCRW